MPTNNIFLFRGDLQHECESPDMEQNYVNSDKAQWKEPKLATVIGSKVSVGTNTQCKQACVLQCKSQSKTWA